jgi:hypothetical protein
MSAKRERLRPRFEGILKTAYRFQALAAPNSEMWKSKLTEDDLEKLMPILKKIDRETAAAQVALKLEDQEEPLAALKAIRMNFFNFRMAVARSSTERNEDEAGKASDLSIKLATEIDAALPNLEKALLDRLEALIPPHSSASSKPARFLEWLGFGD